MAVDIKSLVEAMKGGGQSDALIIDRLITNPNISDEAKKVFQNHKLVGTQTKGIQDLMEVLETQPVEPSITPMRSLGEEKGVRGAIGKTAEFMGAEPLARTIAGRVSGLTQEQTGVTGRQLAGSALQTGLTATAPFLGKAVAGIKGGAALGAALGAGGAMQQEGGDVGAGALVGGAIGGAIPIAGKVIGYVASRYPSFLSLFTGESNEVIRSAMKNPSVADKSVQAGDEGLRQFIESGSKNSIKMRDSFRIAQGKMKEGIAEVVPQVRIDKKGLINSFRELLTKEKVKIGKGGILDFTGSDIIANPGEVSKIQNAWKLLQTKKGVFNFLETDELKQTIGKLTRFADEVGVPSKSPTLGKFYHDIDKTILKSLPEAQREIYSSYNKNFSEMIDTFDDIVDAFNRGDPFKRLAGVFGTNQDELRRLIQFYEKQTGQDLSAVVAGRQLGIEKGKGALFAILSPRSWIDMMLSPQVKGKLVTNSGKFANFMKSGVFKGLQEIPEEQLNRVGRSLQQASPISEIKGGIRSLSRPFISKTGRNLSE